MGRNYDLLKREKAFIEAENQNLKLRLQAAYNLLSFSKKKANYTVAELSDISYPMATKLRDALKKIDIYLYDTSDYVDLISKKRLFIISTSKMEKETILFIIKEKYAKPR